MQFADVGKVPEAGDVLLYESGKWKAGAPPMLSVVAAQFIQPTPGQTVQVTLNTTGWMGPGQVVYIFNGGYYQVSSVNSRTSATLLNLDYPGNKAEGISVNPGNPVVAAGIKGTDGSTIIQASVPPVNGAGRNGDYWYDQNTYMFYGPKSSGTWPAGFSVKGVDGKNIELQSNGTYIQWRAVGDTTWNNLAALSALQGPQGVQGPDNVIRFQLSNGPVFRRLATLPASNNGTYDDTIITGSFGGWGGEQKCMLAGRFGNRNGFYYNYNFEGTQTQASIRAYQQADGSVVIGMYTGATFAAGVFQVYSNQAIVDLNATQMSVAGLTLKFDSALPNTYPPDWRFDVGGFTARDGMAAPRIFGTAMPEVNSTVLSNKDLTITVRENSSTEIVKVSLSQLKQMLSTTTSTISAQAANTAEAFTYNAGQHFTEPFGFPLSFSISGGPAGISINSSTGVFSGMATQSGTFTVVVTATDICGWPVNVSFQLTVVQVGTAVEKLYYQWDSNTKGYWAYARVSDTNNSIAYEVLLSPLQGQTAPAQTYRTMEAGSWTFGTITYNRRYQYVPGFAGGVDVPAGWWRQRVRKVTDTSVARQADVQLVAGVNSSADITDNGNYTPPANNAPVWQAGGPYRVARRRQSVVQIPEAIDPDGNPVLYSAGTLPAGLSFNSSTRQITGLTEVAVGDYLATITATDSLGASSPMTITLTVAMSACTDFRTVTAGDNVGSQQFIYERNAAYANNYGNPRGFASTAELISSMQTENSGYYNFDFARVTGNSWVAGSRVWNSNNPNLTSGYYDYPYDEPAWIARNAVWTGGQLQSVQMIRLNDCGVIQEVQTYTAGSTAPGTFHYQAPPLLSSWPESETRINYHGKPLGPGKMSLSNGTVRAEMWQGYGATVGLFALAGDTNVINQTDHGRGADIGVYTGPEPNYNQNGKYPNPNWPGLGYNPLGIGDSYNNSSQVLAYGKSTDGSEMYSYCRMWLWPLDNEPSDAYLHRWARLAGRACEVFTKLVMSRSDKTFYAADQQERPCFMINGSRRNVVFYNGSSPWTRGGVTVTSGYEVVAGSEVPHEQTPFHVSEPWIGVQVGTVGGQMLVAALWCPDGYRMCYTHYAQNDTATGDLDNACTYLANSPMAIIDSDATYYFRHTYLLGTVDQIRDYVYAQTRQTKPDWPFSTANGRNDWHPWKSTDQKMPFPQDSWRVVMQDHESKLVSAMGSWAASGITNLKIQMAYTGSRSQLFVIWYRSGQKPSGFNPDRPSQESIRWPNGTIAGPEYDNQSMIFPVTGDGVERTYTINVASKSGWTGTVQQFEIGYYYGWAGTVSAGEIFNVKRIWCE